jgi:PLP dependent protein
LQSNKARKAIDAFHVIETVDSVGLARRIDLLAADIQAGHAVDPPWRHPVLLQVNVDADPAKSGFQPDSIEAALEEIRTLGHLELRGLMTVGRLVPTAEDARPTFRALRELSARLRAGPAGITLGQDLSMGMTDDYPIAVEEGATIVRVGRALFGERPHDRDHRH